MPTFSIRPCAVLLIALLGIGGALALASEPAAAAPKAAKAAKKPYRASAATGERTYFGVACDQRYVMPGCTYDPNRDNHTGGF